MRFLRRMMIPMIMAAAACSEPTLGPVDGPQRDAAEAARTNAAVYWNEVARGLVKRHGSNPFVAVRAYALVSVAQYNGAVSTPELPTARRRAFVQAAITRASVDALAYIYPAAADSLEQLATQFLAASRRPADRAEDEQAGLAAGAASAADVVERAVTDGFSAPWTGTVPTGAGVWYSSTVPASAPTMPMLGLVRPYVLESGSQFRPAPPPAFGSAAYLAALAEVRQVTGARTALQDSLAKFWALPGGTYTPTGYWNDEACRLAVRHGLQDVEAAHLLAVVNMVGMDALVASHDAKYAYWLIRPSQADAAVQLAVGLPNFPSYPSNHATLSAGMARVIGAWFPGERPRLDALAEEAAMSRLYGGIHYRFDNDAGLRMGRQIARWALDHDVRSGVQIVLK